MDGERSNKGEEKVAENTGGTEGRHRSGEAGGRKRKLDEKDSTGKAKLET